jgi:hypothetical protein
MMNNPQGKINLPEDNAMVSRNILAEGTAADLPAGRYLFLVVEVDGLMWPKCEVEVKNLTWTCEVCEGGNPPGGRFGLSLFMVGDRGYADINAWLERGKMTGDYPGIMNLKDSIRLHSVWLRLSS